MTNIISNTQVLSRREMKNIKAGNGGDCWLTCGGCNNDTCRGYVNDCSVQSIWPICGSHDTDWTCTCSSIGEA